MGVNRFYERAPFSLEEWYVLETGEIWNMASSMLLNNATYALF